MSRKRTPKMPPRSLEQIAIDEKISGRPTIDADVIDSASVEGSMPVKSKAINTEIQKTETVKATFLLTPEITSRLEMSQARMRAILGGKKRLVTKSKIVEAALIFALDEYDQYEQDSRIAVFLSKQKT